MQSLNDFSKSKDSVKLPFGPFLIFFLEKIQSSTLFLIDFGVLKI